MARSTRIFDQIKGLLGSISADEATGEITRIDTEIEALRHEQAKWRTLLGLIQQLGANNGTSVEADHVPTMREAIKLVLEAHPPGRALKLAHIGEEIIDRGWMEDITKDWQRLQMMASDMKKRNQLERQQTGFYRLPLSDAAEREGKETLGS